MIWKSIFLMTVIDILILGVVGYTAVGFLRNRPQLVRSSEIGFLAILGGLSLVALFYLTDLLVMHVFPSFMPRAEVMATMRELHLNGSWLVALLGTGAICIGFTSINRGTAGLLGDLEEREGSLVRELAERKRVEEALRDSRDRLHLIADNLPVFISYFDRDRRFRFVNRTAQQWYASSEEGVVGRAIREVIGPEPHEQLNAHLETALGGMEQRFEQTRTYPDGQARAIETTYVPHLDESGDVQGCFALVHDLTERKQAEEEIRKLNEELERRVEERTAEWRDANTALQREIVERRRSQGLYKALLIAAPDPIVTVDQDGEIVMVNRQVERVFGYGSEELIGQSVETFLPEYLRGRHVRHRSDYFGDPQIRPMGSGLDLVARCKMVASCPWKSV